MDVVAYVRKQILEDFERTPEDMKVSFCIERFHHYLSPPESVGDRKGRKNYMAPRLRALEQAIRDDAGRPDVWNSVLETITAVVAATKRVARERKKERARQKQSK